MDRPHGTRGDLLAVNLANLGRALPSLAVMGIWSPITVAIDPDLGFKVYPTFIAMVILAIPPILVNAYTGHLGGRSRPGRGGARDGLP